LSSKFSDRIGVTEPVTSLQATSINEELRNSIWNVILSILNVANDSEYLDKAVHAIAMSLLKKPVDELPNRHHTRHVWLKEVYSKLDWHEVYNLIEFLVSRAGYITGLEHRREPWINQFNLVLKRELSGYRFISGVLTPISSEAEVASIDEAIGAAEHAGLNGVRAHLTAALEKLGQKPEPDYRNSIKEAISAVESAVKCITGSSDGGLEKALSELASESEIHGALKEGFIKLYGYTSDENGIRHAILEESDVGYDEAKFMVVACSAFVNFLIAKAEAASLLGDK